MMRGIDEILSRNDEARRQGALLAACIDVARSAKKFKVADSIRRRLTIAGFSVMSSKKGTSVYMEIGQHIDHRLRAMACWIRPGPRVWRWKYSVKNIPAPPAMQRGRLR